MVDALDSGSSGHCAHRGSIPLLDTTFEDGRRNERRFFMPVTCFRRSPS